VLRLPPSTSRRAAPGASGREKNEITPPIAPLPYRFDVPPSTTSTRSSRNFGTRPQSIHSPHASFTGMPSNSTAVRPSSTPRMDTICAVPPTRLLVRGSSTPGISRSRSCDSRAGLVSMCWGVSTFTVVATWRASSAVCVAVVTTLDRSSDPGCIATLSVTVPPRLTSTGWRDGRYPSAVTSTSYRPLGRSRSTKPPDASVVTTRAGDATATRALSSGVPPCAAVTVPRTLPALCAAADAAGTAVATVVTIATTARDDGRPDRGTTRDIDVGGWRG